MTKAPAAGRPVAVDNTDPSPKEWGPQIASGHEPGAAVEAYWSPPGVEGSLRRNAPPARGPNAYGTSASTPPCKLRRPSVAEDFDTVYALRCDGAGGFHVRALRHTAEPPSPD
ncbi:hypothetical protein AB0903_03865 [Streptomyces sp. NPDC048389]|uniref:hypothetical protein n=1 Tax=Streptomyces sp. NPDC048389 TaxID=3154622 RepID=UPI003451FE74